MAPTPPNVARPSQSRRYNVCRPRAPPWQALHHLNDLAPDGGSRVPEAESAYRSALAFAAPSAAAAALPVRSNLGALLMAAGRLDDAVAELEGALAASVTLGLPPSSRASMHFNRGKALAAAGRLAEADAAYLEAARAAAGTDLSTYGKALAAARTLPAAAATAAARVAARARRRMAARPGLAFLSDLEAAWPEDGAAEDGSGSGSVGKKAGAGREEASSSGDSGGSGSGGEGTGSGCGDDEEVATWAGGGTGDNWLDKGTAQDLSWLHFALYGQEHRARRGALAWAHLTAGNRLMAASGSYDSSRDREAAAQVMDVFTGPFEAGGGPAGSEGAIFVVGLPRSGSTLIEQMLGSHSQVRGLQKEGAAASFSCGCVWSVCCARPQRICRAPRCTRRPPRRPLLLPQVFAAGEDTLLAPLASAMQAELAGPAADQEAVLARYGARYLEEMRARAPAGSDPKYVVDKMLVGRRAKGDANMQG
jgi:tetratricopeptide (TPR) repeat protein